MVDVMVFCLGLPNKIKKCFPHPTTLMAISFSIYRPEHVKEAFELQVGFSWWVNIYDFVLIHPNFLV